MKVGARMGRKQMLKWDFGAGSPTVWLAMRTLSLAVDAEQAQGSIAIVQTFTDDELGWCTSGRKCTRVWYMRYLRNMGK